jgi:hypothetical protein
MTYFGIPRGRRKAFSQVRLVTDNTGVTTRYRDGVSEGVVTYTTAGYTELVSAAQCTKVVNQVEIFDSTGNTSLLSTGAAASEVVLIQVTPGGNGIIGLRIDAGTRIAIKPLVTPSNNTECTINFYD